MTAWRSMSTAPRDGRPFLLLQPNVRIGQGWARATPHLAVLQRAWCGERVGPGFWMMPGVCSLADRMAGGLWAPLEALPLEDLHPAGLRDRPPAPWAPFTSAPQDGRWFIVLVPQHLEAGIPGRNWPSLLLLRRQDMPGYRWVSTTSERGVADSYLGEAAIWAELDALPLRELYTAGPARPPEPFG